MTTNPVQHLGLFVTESCNLACPYCYASKMESRVIDEKIARIAIDLFLSEANPAKRVAITFWGGEPLLAFDLLTRLIRHAEERAAQYQKDVHFAIPTNLTLLSAPMLDFFQSHDVNLSLSLDGTARSQGLRRTRRGESTFPIVAEKLALIRSRYKKRLPAVRMTVSPETAEDFFKNVLFFLDQGFRQVYFAPVVENEWPAEALARLEAEQQRLLNYWLDALQQGRSLSFNTWDKALVWRELRRRGHLPEGRGIPCGAGTGMLALDIHGNFFPCHRFVFYDKSTRAGALGSVVDGPPTAKDLAAYASLKRDQLGTKTTRCTSCTIADHCTQVCPALNYALTGDILEVHEHLCQFARLETRIVDQLEAQGKEMPEFQRYVTDYLMRVYAPGTLTASVSALFARLDAKDVDRLADRAIKILEDLPGRHRAR